MAEEQAVDPMELLRIARETLGLSQEAFGKRLGVTKRTVIRWEKGENPAAYIMLPTAAHLVRRTSPALAEKMVQLAYALAERDGAGRKVIDDRGLPTPTAEAEAAQRAVELLAATLGVSKERAHAALLQTLTAAQDAGLVANQLREELRLLGPAAR